MLKEITALRYFEQIVNQLVQYNDQLKVGKVMSAPAIKLGDEAFAFYSANHEMVFKLGDAYQDKGLDLKVFNPFKNRQPFYGWYKVSFANKNHWPALTLQALEYARALTDA